jgi:hypothetical protein
MYMSKLKLLHIWQDYIPKKFDKGFFFKIKNLKTTTESKTTTLSQSVASP